VTGDGQCRAAHQELGVYLLGAVEPAQRALVERHLAVCPRCRAELAGLAGLPSLLRRVPAGEALRLAPDVAAALGPVPSLAVLARRVSSGRPRSRGSGAPVGRHG
jgi:predicted anti-sigma-YlaC factor YlaD